MHLALANAIQEKDLLAFLRAGKDLLAFFFRAKDLLAGKSWMERKLTMWHRGQHRQWPCLVTSSTSSAMRESSMYEVLSEIYLQNLFRNECNFS